MENSLWYRQPAANFNEALPIGNGRFGAMVYGTVPEEHLSLNADTLWSGGPRDFRVTDGPGLLARIKTAVEAGDYHTADELSKKLQGPYTGSFLPMADLWIACAGNFDTVGDYRRSLEIDSALAHTEFSADGIKYRREYFAENPSHVLLLRFDADKPGRLSCKIRMSTRLHGRTEADGTRLILFGEAPYLVDPSYYGRDRVEYDDNRGMRFAVVLDLLAEGGQVEAEDGLLKVTGADRLELRLAAATGFRSPFEPPLRDYPAIVERALSRLKLAEDHSYRRIRSLHMADFGALYDRCGLRLESDPAFRRMPTDERLRQFDGRDTSLAALLFNYGRYLLISCSRRGTQPANLQGMWNEELRAPWSSNYTININTQMNYWPVESANLSACAEPLFNLIESLSVTGRRSAAGYGCGGWCAHHNTDLWALSTMVGMGGVTDDDVWWPEGGHIPQCVTWMWGGAWLCRHLYEHFLFTQDRNFLRMRAYPILRGAAEFALDFLRPVKIKGVEYLATVPSTSPENLFTAPDGEPAAVSAGSTMDMFIIRELFHNTIAAAELLKVDPPLVARMRDALEKLPPIPVDPVSGRLREWSIDFPDHEVHHRHVSHLYGLHPSDQIDDLSTPELFRAARRTLEIRGDDGTGWSLAWKINFQARLLDGDHAWEMIRMMLRMVESGGGIRYNGGGGVFPNLFDAHPPFQIDGNFGAVAGMVELLVQSHHGYWHLFPALPRAWQAGEANGLRLRGNAEIDLAWKDGKLTVGELRPGIGGLVRLRYTGDLKVSVARTPVTVERNGEFLTFEADAGAKYKLTGC